MLPNARLVFARAPNRDADFETVIRALMDGLHKRLRRESFNPGGVERRDG